MTCRLNVLYQIIIRISTDFHGMFSLNEIFYGFFYDKFKLYPLRKNRPARFSVCLPSRRAILPPTITHCTPRAVCTGFK